MIMMERVMVRSTALKITTKDGAATRKRRRMDEWRGELFFVTPQKISEGVLGAGSGSCRCGELSWASQARRSEVGEGLQALLERWCLEPGAAQCVVYGVPHNTKHW